MSIPRLIFQHRDTEVRIWVQILMLQVEFQKKKHPTDHKMGTSLNSVGKVKYRL